MAPEKVRVAIVDSVETRGTAMAASFSGIADAYWFSFENGQWESNPREGFSLEFTVRLWHAGDYQKQQTKPVVSAGKTFYYGGNGGSDSRIPANAERIWRVVLPGNGTLSQKEAEEILEYAQGRRGTPVILTPPSSMEHLVALCVLCQGYLAATARKAGDRWEPQEIHDVLINVMGWNDAVANACGDNRNDHADRVKRIGWWQNVFPEYSKVDLENRLRFELKLEPLASMPKGIADMIAEVFPEPDSARECVRPEKVARAYEEIARRLAHT